MDFLTQLSGQGAVRPEDAEVKLDLRNLKREDALEKLDTTVKHCKKCAAPTLYVTFDPARPGEGETLFQPVARYFKFEKINGYVEHAQPIMTPESGGLFVRFKL